MLGMQHTFLSFFGQVPSDEDGHTQGAKRHEDASGEFVKGIEELIKEDAREDKGYHDTRSDDDAFFAVQGMFGVLRGFAEESDRHFHE